MSYARYWADWEACSDPPPESCADAGCPVHGDDIHDEEDEEELPMPP